MRGRAAVVSVVVCLTAADAQAGDPDVDGIVLASPCEDRPHRCGQAPLVFDETDALPIEWNFDTGWVPQGSPLQVRLQSLLAAYTRIRLEGTLFTDWQVPDYDAQLVFDAPGRPEGGLLDYHYGLLVLAEGKVQLNVGPNTSINWQGKIPYIPKVDLQVDEEVVFDAWGWDPGVTSQTKSDPQTVALFDMTQLFGVNIPGLQSGFALDVAMELEVGWTNHRIVVEMAEDGTMHEVEGGPITSAGQITHEPAQDAGFAEVDVHPEGTVHYDGTLHLIPSLYVKALGNTWTMPLLSIPVPVVATDADWIFAPQRVHVPLPNFELLDEMADFGTVTLGDEAFFGYLARSKGQASVVAEIETTDPDAFVVVESELELAPLQDAVASVRFVPQHVGLHEADLIIHTNDPDQPDHVLPLRGLGVAPELAPVPAPGGGDPGTIREAGCGCSLPGRAPGSGWVMALGVALWGLRRRRRDHQRRIEPRS